jgi:NAD-dependent deacetylase
MRILAVTGAGISAESGIPTFRGEGGYWRNLDAAKLATETAFFKDPKTVWEWYRERRQLIRKSQPNPAHEALVKLAYMTSDFLLVTQNVDDLHARAEWQSHRLPPERMVQIHGDIFVTRCSRCDFQRRENGENEAGVPVCPRCHGYMRPGVVFFDEELDPHEVARVERFLGEGSCQVVLVVGTTGAFDYIVGWSSAAKGADGRLLEINPEPTVLSTLATETIRAPAATVLPDLVNRLVDG